MQQVLLNNNGALLARAPTPAVGAHCVLVKTHYSMISVGTELAPLKAIIAEQQAAAQAPVTEKAIGRSKLAAYYLTKAARRPDLALRKVKRLAMQRFHAAQEPLVIGDNGSEKDQPVTPFDRNDMFDMGWNVGYSAVGEVVSVGTGVSDLSVGQMVACAGAGMANHAQYNVLPRHMVCPLPKGCDAQAAASTTIGVIALQGVRRAQPQLDEHVVVLGLGLIGQITCQLLKANGCRVYGLDLDPSRVDKALSLGLDVGSADADTLADLLMSQTQSQGADIVMITAATKSNAVINQAMQLCRRKGKVVVVGDVGLDVARADFYRKEIDLLMSTSYGPGRYDRGYEIEGQDYPYAYVRWTENRNMQAYLQMVYDGRVDVNALIEQVVPVQDVAKAYDELARSKTPPLGVLLEYDVQNNQIDNTVISLNGHRKAPQKAINYALVGVGAFGTSMLVPKLKNTGKPFFLKGVVSSDATRAGNYARQEQLELIGSNVADMAGRDDIDMLVIATRHDKHAEQVIAGLQAGKHVFVEKPLAISWEQLNAVQQAYDECQEKPMLMVGFNRRFSPAMQAIKQATTCRQSPLMIQYRLNGGFIPASSWLQDKQGGGRNIGEACHMYDCFQFLTGSKVVSVHAESIDAHDRKYLKNDNFVATLRYEDGSVAVLTYTALGPKQGLPKERVEVYCDGECYLLDDYKSLTKSSEQKVLWHNENTYKGHSNQMAEVAKFLTGEANSLPAVSDLFETTAVALLVEDLLHDRA